MANKKKSLLNLEEVSRFDNLLIFAKSVVDGYFSGRHKAVSYGSSSQFKDYSIYQQGDDISKIDWRLYARTQRLYTRRYDNETDMVVYLLIDMSASMGYGDKVSKTLLASQIAAALTYLMINQGDKVSIVLFDTRIRDYSAPGSTRVHMYNAIKTLENAEPTLQTDIVNTLHECHALFKKRGRLILISDFWGADAALFDALSLFLHRRFEVLLMQVLDEEELRLPQYDNVRFVDMETKEQIQIEPDEIRAYYKKNMQSFLDRMAQNSEGRKISYSLLSTKKPYLEAIESYLGFRKGEY